MRASAFIAGVAFVAATAALAASDRVGARKALLLSRRAR